MSRCQLLSLSGSYSLRVKLLVPLLAFGTVLGSIGSGLVHTAFRSRLEMQLIRRSEVVLHAVNYAAETARSKNDISRFVSAIGGDADVQLIVLVTDEPRVVACTKLSWVGERLEDLNNANVESHIRNVLKSRIDERHFDEDTNSFDLLAPLLLSTEDKPGKHLERGVVMVRLDASPFQRELSQAMWELVGYLLGMICGLLVLTYTVLHWVVLRPAHGITQAIARRSAGEAQVRAPVGSMDEMGAIAREFNELLDALSREAEHREELHHQLVSASREAGMVETATGVLHNVGNVLNSVNVSASVVREKVRTSPLAGLAQLSALLKAHEHDLPQYLSGDDKSRQVVEFVTALNEHVATEQVAISNELESLARNVEHIKRIISVQQTQAKTTSLMESVQLSNIVEDALRINDSGLRKLQIQVERVYWPLQDVLTDRHRVLQILVNLVSNARHALGAIDRSDHRIRVEIAPLQTDRVRICVTDNGIGMTNENLSECFALGFTTRSDGHGFGLHTSALAARMLGGSLMAQSEGPGMGSTFTLELPLSQEEEDAGR